MTIPSRFEARGFGRWEFRVVGNFGMKARNHAQLWFGAPLVASSLVLAGCVGAPTYGTDKTSTEQLAEDMTGILSLAPTRKPPIDYKPRPELVKPASAEVLPAPQEKVANVSNPSWPESPEQRRARLRADATANQDNPGYDSPIVNDVVDTAESSSKPIPLGQSWRVQDSGLNGSVDPRAQREAFNKRLAETQQGSETRRKYLSEPPLTYRQAAETAPVGDVGEDEVKKERRAKAAARKKGDWSWRQLIPGG